MKRPLRHQPEGGVRVVVLVLVLMGVVSNILRLGPLAVNIPSVMSGSSPLLTLQQLQVSDKADGSAARDKRSLLYQLKPAQKRSDHEVYLAQQKCGYHSDSYSKFIQQKKQFRSSSNEDKTI
jgi:hypothetical protein